MLPHDVFQNHHPTALSLTSWLCIAISLKNAPVAVHISLFTTHHPSYALQNLRGAGATLYQACINSLAPPAHNYSMRCAGNLPRTRPSTSPGARIHERDTLGTPSEPSLEPQFMDEATPDPSRAIPPPRLYQRNRLVPSSTSPKPSRQPEPTGVIDSDPSQSQLRTRIKQRDIHVPPRYIPPTRISHPVDHNSRMSQPRTP